MLLVEQLSNAYRRLLEIAAVEPRRRRLGQTLITTAWTGAALTAAVRTASPFVALAGFGASRAPAPAALTASVMTAILTVALAAFGASQAQAPPAASVITAILTVALAAFGAAPAQAPARAPPAPVALS